MAISKRDLEVAALNWKVRAENAQRRVEELEHAFNLLVNDSVEWFTHHQTSDGAHHDFGIAVAFEVPINDPISRVVRGADVENLPLIFWRTTWPEGGKFMAVNTQKDFVARKKVVLEPGGDAQPSAELAELIQRVADEWEEAYRRYVAERESPVIH